MKKKWSYRKLFLKRVLYYLSQSYLRILVTMAFDIEILVSRAFTGSLWYLKLKLE